GAEGGPHGSVARPDEGRSQAASVPFRHDRQLPWVRAKKFIAYHRRPAEKMGESEVRQFLLHLVEERHIAPAGHKMHVAALKFLYSVTLDRPEVAVKLPWPRVPVKLPDILDESEVERLIEAIDSIKHRAIIMTASGAGLRISEACSLRTTSIDSQRGL